MTLLITTTTTI